jgi:hypothetical protein
MSTAMLNDMPIEHIFVAGHHRVLPETFALNMDGVPELAAGHRHTALGSLLNQFRAGPSRNIHSHCELGSDLR